MFDIFGVSQKKLQLVFPTNETTGNPIMTKVLAIKRHIEAAMGGVPFCLRRQNNQAHGIDWCTKC